MRSPVIVPLPVVYRCGACRHEFRGVRVESLSDMRCVQCDGDTEVVHRDRGRIVRDMMELERRTKRLTVMAAELRGLNFAELAEQAEYVVRVERGKWWGLAGELGVEVTSSVEDIRRLAALAVAERARIENGRDS